MRRLLLNREFQIVCSFFFAFCIFRFFIEIYICVVADGLVTACRHTFCAQGIKLSFQ